MSVFAAALATLHADANLAEAGSFRRPPGAWAAVRVIRSDPSAVAAGLGQLGARAVALQADVLTAAITVAPARGDELKLGTVTYRVEEAEPDSLGLSYRLSLARVSEDPIPVVGTFRLEVDALT